MIQYLVKEAYNSDPPRGVVALPIDVAEKPVSVTIHDHPQSLARSNDAQ